MADNTPPLADPATTQDTAPVTPDRQTVESSSALPPASPMGPDTSGFYRLQGDSLQFAPNEVHAPGYNLSRSTRAATALPKDGWDWFHNAEAAYAHHNLPQPAAPELGESQGDSHRRRPPGAGPR